jgi:hypothetical protein
MIGPLSPDEVLRKGKDRIPEQVYDVFNELLMERWNGLSQVTIHQEEVMHALLIRLAPIKRQEIYDRHWLDIEDIYRRYGWDVTFDRPDPGESGAAHWLFSKG